MKAASFSAANANESGKLDLLAVEGAKMTGSSTSTNTVKMSSTTSQPIAIVPVWLWSWLLSERTRVSTTVLATDSASPKTIPAGQSQPKSLAVSAPSTVASALWQI